MTRKIPKILIALSVAALIACSNGGDGKKPDLPQIDYEKYTLDNGLQVVLHEDKSDPIVSVHIRYHVGSGRERPGKTGFAHFFEHMLFQRSENLGRNEYLLKVREMGGDFNGATEPDGTYYYQTVPRDALEKALWMESDRMGFFINTVTKAGMEREIDIVSNEKRQSQNAAYGKANELLNSLYYPHGHPYSWQVIGSIRDLRSSTLDDVKEFYGKYYTPSNATLVIAGDFDNAQVKILVEKYFGEIADRGTVEPVEPRPVTLEKTVRYYFEDTYGVNPYIDIRYPAVEQYHPDMYPLKLATQILSSGRNSPFTQVLVTERKLASSAFISSVNFEADGYVGISIYPYRDIALDDIWDGIQEAYSRFEAMPADSLQSELERAQVQYEMMAYNLLTDVGTKAQLMARNNSYSGSPDRQITDVKKYYEVTVDDIRRVYDKYIKDKPYFALSGVPAGKSHLALSGSAKVEPVQDDFENPMSSGNSASGDTDDYIRTPSAFDRSVEPPLLSNTPSLNIPGIWEFKAKNGMDVSGIVYNELPVTNFAIVLNEGPWIDPPRKAGLAAVTAAVMNSGTANCTPEELSAILGRMGSRLSITATDDNMILYGYCLNRNIDKTLDIVREMLLEPRWDEQELGNVKLRFKNTIRKMKTDPKDIARGVLDDVLFGTGSRAALPVYGTEESLDRINMEDVKAFYAANINPSNAAFRYVGSKAPLEVENMLARLTEAWTNGEASSSVFASKDAAPADAKVYFVDFPGASQSYILLGREGMPIASADYYPTRVVNYKLGGSGSSSILFDELRLKRGYTYGASSGISATLHKNLIRIYSSVQSAYTVESMKIMRDVLQDYPGRFDRETLDNTTHTMLLSDLDQFEKPDALLDMLLRMYIYGLPPDYVSRQRTVLETITLDQAEGYIGKWLDYGRMVFVVVGDAKTQLPKIRTAGFGKVVQVNIH